MPSRPSIAELAERIERLLEAASRIVIGVAGEPGAGKSTISGALLAALVDRGIAAVVVPMDGFHLANSELARLELAECKGSPDTFDAGGYAALLARLRVSASELVYAPTYDRSIEESIANAIAVPAGTHVVITEGNYLLMTEGPWALVAPQLDEVWAVRLDPEVRQRRLIARHERFGKSPEEARNWVRRVDERNAALVAPTLDRADVQIWEGEPPGEDVPR